MLGGGEGAPAEAGAARVQPLSLQARRRVWSGSSAGRRQSRRWPPMAGKTDPTPEIQGCLLPSGSFCKKKLAERPGYMRTGELQRIEFHPSVDCEPLIPKELEHRVRKQHRDFKICSLKRSCKNNLGSTHCNVCVCTKLSSDVATGSATVEIAADHRVQQSENLILPVSSPVAVCKEDALPVYSSYSLQTDSLDSAKDTACHGSSQEKKRMHAFSQKTVNDNLEFESKDIACSSISQGHFNSSFSFIQQSLNPAFETSGIMGQSDCSDPKDILQVCKVGKSDNGNSHVLGEAQENLGGKLWASSHSCVRAEDCKCPRETIEDDKLYNFESLSLLYGNAAFSYSTDSLDATSAGSSVTSGYESSTNASDHSWDSLIRKYEPVLQECLLENQSVLKKQFSIIKLQKLQENAVAEDDYERADKFRRKLEELENEKRSLKFQLPSQQPSISSFLDRFRIQVQMALCGDVHRFNREETVFLQKSEQKVFSLTCQEKIQVSLNKRDQLLKEKQWIQKEIELLRARMAVLEAKDQQLRREIENQDCIIQLQNSELSTLLSWVSHGELQAIGKALADTLEASHQIPCSLDFPESIKRLQEKEQSLNMSIKNTAAKVRTSQKLCSTLRGKVSDIETQLPALLEAKMLAVSGGNFCTAKDLVEEIKSLTTERERLEGLLHEWLVLSARNVQKLERMKEGYKKLKEEMEQREAAFERTLKENILKYMAILEEQLQSCVSQFLERVWEVDLEACQLLIQEFQLKEGGCCVFEGEGSQTDEMEDTADVLLSTKRRQSKCFPIKDFKQSAVQHPVTQNKHPSAHWDLKQESPVLSTELEEKCEQISEKLLHLEDQLQIAICSCDENLSQSLQREIQMVKEALQAMLVQLQPAKEAEEDAAATSLVTAGVRESKT
ncbi:LOW QUALITY PROTEIN: disrupted in schizophrenia 1 protein [Heteronotia binoei]|uniref:LOW QUALITY PROTEIN: disrupted in schizophrenia 1 protein n=1 Tax=Heteronotia binoei TaxID=13085 RepID=UPI00292E5DA4|nr:LOW QUALITY PROTEIN: disrupted in schizophrenia 1 protein [Heteronotia binoei]